MNALGKISNLVKLLTGQKFGKLTVGKLIGRNARGFLLYECTCDCGNKINVTANRLKQSLTRSCGCLALEVIKAKAPPDHSGKIGKKFGKLTITDINGKRDRFNRLLAQCKCDCGNFKEASLSSITTNRLKSCGCYRLEVVKSKIGPLHNNWNHNKTEEERMSEYDSRRNNENFKQWSRDIKERDNFTCQCCKIRKRNLTSHHLNAWHLFPDERYDLNNGVCLCEDCHRKFHKQYGLKVTRQHFLDFTKNQLV